MKIRAGRRKPQQISRKHRKKNRATRGQAGSRGFGFGFQKEFSAIEAMAFKEQNKGRSIQTTQLMLRAASKAAKQHHHQRMSG